MTFSYEDQVAFARLALKLIDTEDVDEAVLQKLLDVAEAIKAHADPQNAVIYDTTEYLYEQIRLRNGDDGAIDDGEMRRGLEAIING